MINDKALYNIEAEKAIPNINNSNIKLKRSTDRKVILSTVWIFTVLNYMYCDIISFMDAHLLQQYLTGSFSGIKMTQGFLFGASILMEISIAMVLLSRILKYRFNRLANIIAGIITTAVQTSSLLIGKPTAYYILFSIIEIASTAFIIWYSWTWTAAEETHANNIS